ARLPVDLAVVERMLSRSRGASLGFVVPPLVRHAGRATFALLMRHQSANSAEFTDEQLADLAAGLRRHPDALDDLLRLGEGKEARPRAGQITRRAAPSLLPLLGKALTHSSPAVRANAADVCARLSERAMIAPLRKALRRDSARALLAAIDALVALKAREAVPDLLALLPEAAASPAVDLCWGSLSDEFTDELADLTDLKRLRQPWPDAPRDTAQDEGVKERCLTDSPLRDAIRQLDPAAPLPPQPLLRAQDEDDSGGT